MRRHFSARLGLEKGNQVLRCSSTEIPSRTRPRRYHGQFRSQQQQQQQRTMLSHNTIRTCHASTTNRFHRQIPPSCFHGLRACYFSSNVQEQTQSDNKDDDDDDDNNNNHAPIANQLVHLFDDEDDPNKHNYVKTLKSWYLDNHGETGSAIQEAFDTKMIQNPKAGVDGTIRQLFTASFVCPQTNERFEAGNLKGSFEIDNQNFYTRKKIALQAVSAVVLSHKTKTTSGQQVDEETEEDHNNNNNNNNIHNNNQNDQTFRQILQRLYMKRFKTSPTKSQNKVYKQDFVGKTHGGTWWTAEFTCPLTGNVYEAKDLPDVPPAMKMKKAGTIWYRKMSDSVHASASNAIESIDWDAKLHQHDDDKDDDKDNKEKIAENNNNSKELLRPLVSWYAEHGDDDNDDNNADAVEISIEDNFVVTQDKDLWTASFLCPLTGERFDAGTINATTDTISSSTERDKLIWYTEQDAAIQAACQRAYDVFQFRALGVSDPRFCKEDPNGHAPGEVFEITTTTTTTTVFDGSDDELEENAPEVDDNELSEDEDDEDNFIIQVIPQQIIPSSGSQSGSSMTLDIIAKSWIDSTGVSTTQNGNAEDRIENFQNAFVEREQAITRAMEWISRQDTTNSKLSGDRTQFDVQGGMGNLKIANAILSSLAECHQQVPFDSQSSGVEDCALAVLESMWSSNSTRPDAQSYAFYLKCLEGESPRDVAAKAQKIVDAMESGQDENQRSLPKPNDAIYGSLFEIRALSGFDSEIENYAIDSLDRNTHLTRLSAMAHDPSTFDMDIATKLINEMKNLAESKNEASLQPNRETYNAPLRWSGGHLWSRPYSRVIPWDAYGEIFKNGFKPDSKVNAEQKYAELVEQWIEMMISKSSSDSSLAPSIETYESLIQALVRGGNQESLSRAEAIVDKILTGEYLGIRARIQTFYPILAAWTYSGCEQGPEKVEFWMDRLEESMPTLEPRLAFPNISVMAQISLQRQSLEVDPSQIDSSIFDSARKCSALLSNSIDRYKSSQDSPMQSDIFMLLINVWYNAASAAMLQNNMEETKKCFKEIQNTVDQFDDMLVWLHQVGGTESSQLHSEFLKLLNLAPSVYGAQLSAVDAMENNIDSKYYDKTMHLISIEEKLRRLEEFHQFWGDSSNHNEMCMSKANMDVGSIFPSGEFLCDLFCESWSDYIASTLNILEKGTEDSSIGEADFVRLTMLIARITSGASPEVLDSDAKDRVIEMVVKILENYCGDDENRKAVISTVIQALNKRPMNSGSIKKTAQSTTSKYDASNNEVKNRSSYSRSKTPSRSFRRRPRPRPRHAKQSDS